MNASNLPEGARLALMNWPGGQPDAGEIADAMPAGNVRPWYYSDVIPPLLDAGLIERVPNVAARGGGHLFRLTQAGRKAWDVLQSGVE